MIEKLTERRDALKQDLERARQHVVQKESELKELRDVILRLGGAIQINDETIEDLRQRDAE